MPKPTQRLTTPPAPLAGDAGLTFFSTWRVGTPERQQAAVDAIARAWESRPWPHEGLLSYSVYEGVDGSTLMHHSQWRDEQAYQDFFARGRDERNAEIDAAVPGVERLGLMRTGHYRSVAPGASGAGVPRVYTTVELAAPGAGGGEAAADEVLSAWAGASGLVAAHAYLGTDGGRVFVYGEWEDGDGDGEAVPAVEGAERRYRFAFGVGPR
ncbi:antibiotic biosynthesis monooxygenase [Streptomyces longispororuber]|uniref:Antibiotic biosynthesis monooxygenase n=1 Tax=Streptomyces longispororuber TaxID=68230 RepID=A0A918ZIT2_9ACTN|nr:antibiotic biosynthesis monooxygenase [Streptomyces longispororuber]GHE55139.1 antibiotic biosynthesis monooxygenase [Streptomyces longispororuber]